MHSVSKMDEIHDIVASFTFRAWRLLILVLFAVLGGVEVPTRFSSAGESNTSTHPDVSTS
jgi:hypothetical protein